MLTSAAEFIRLRKSDDLREQKRASKDFADINVWLEIIAKYPDFKIWVIHNKTIPVEILEILSRDSDAEVRSAVARKRKINQTIKLDLSQDIDENVRFALMSNSTMTITELNQIRVEDSAWLKEQIEERKRNAYS